MSSSDDDVKKIVARKPIFAASSDDEVKVKKEVPKAVAKKVQLSDSETDLPAKTTRQGADDDKEKAAAAAAKKPAARKPLGSSSDSDKAPAKPVARKAPASSDSDTDKMLAAARAKASATAKPAAAKKPLSDSDDDAVKKPVVKPAAKKPLSDSDDDLAKKKPAAAAPVSKPAAKGSDSDKEPPKPAAPAAAPAAVTPAPAPTPAAKKPSSDSDDDLGIVKAKPAPAAAPVAATPTPAPATAAPPVTAAPAAKPAAKGDSDSDAELGIVKAAPVATPTPAPAPVVAAPAPAPTLAPPPAPVEVSRPGTPVGNTAPPPSHVPGKPPVSDSDEDIGIVSAKPPPIAVPAPAPVTAAPVTAPVATPTRPPVTVVSESSSDDDIPAKVPVVAPAAAAPATVHAAPAATPAPAPAAPVAAPALVAPVVAPVMPISAVAAPPAPAPLTTEEEQMNALLRSVLDDDTVRTMRVRERLRGQPIRDDLSDVAEKEILGAVMNDTSDSDADTRAPVRAPAPAAPETERERHKRLVDSVREDALVQSIIAEDGRRAPLHADRPSIYDAPVPLAPVPMDTQNRYPPVVQEARALARGTAPGPRGAPVDSSGFVIQRERPSFESAGVSLVEYASYGRQYYDDPSRRRGGSVEPEDYAVASIDYNSRPRERAVRPAVAAVSGDPEDREILERVMDDASEGAPTPRGPRADTQRAQSIQRAQEMPRVQSRAPVAPISQPPKARVREQVAPRRVQSPQLSEFDSTDGYEDAVAEVLIRGTLRGSGSSNINNTRGASAEIPAVVTSTAAPTQRPRTAAQAARGTAMVSASPRDQAILQRVMDDDATEQSEVSPRGGGRADYAVASVSVRRAPRDANEQSTAPRRAQADGEGHGRGQSQGRAHTGASARRMNNSPSETNLLQNILEGGSSRASSRRSSVASATGNVVFDDQRLRVNHSRERDTEYEQDERGGPQRKRKFAVKRSLLAAIQHLFAGFVLPDGALLSLESLAAVLGEDLMAGMTAEDLGHLRLRDVLQSLQLAQRHVEEDVSPAILEKIKAAKQARTLSLIRSGLSVLPSRATRLAFLEKLYLNENQLMTLPPTICHLKSLRVLAASSNEIAFLPGEMGLLTQLEELHLAHNKLTALPPTLTNLTNLVWLDLSHNMLVVVPPEIVQMTALRSLDLSNSELAALPARISNLAQLRGLYLLQNSLASIPPSIGALANLATLALEGNQLVDLPREILSLTSLARVSLEHNPIDASSPVVHALMQRLTSVVG